MQNNCNACGENNCLSYYNKEQNIVSCNKCEAIFSKNESTTSPPSTAVDKNDSGFSKKLTIFLRKQMAKIVAEGYIDYLQLKTDMSFTNALDIGAAFGSLVNELNKKGINTPNRLCLLGLGLMNVSFQILLRRNRIYV